MKHCYLEVTYRKGRPLAAYYYIPRHDGDTSARTERVEGGLLVDYSKDDRPIGIEIPAPSRLNVTQLNDVLVAIGLEPIQKDELAPLFAA